jgi:cysteine dioxygenase
MGLELELLRQLAVHQADAEKIESLFRASGLDASRLGRINSKADGLMPYSRIVLSSEAACEVMVARWSPAQWCAPHDHGASAGWVYYLEGDFMEQHYRWADGRLLPGALERHAARTHTQVSKDEIHSCICQGSGLSLHIYFPRIARMRVYDLNQRQTIVVADDCGAWIPNNARQRLEEIAWA